MAIRSATPGSMSGSAPPAAPSTAASTALTIPVKLPNGSVVNVSSQAEVDALRNAYSRQQTVDLSSGGGDTGGMLEIAADGFQAVSGFLAGSKYNRLLSDMQDSRTKLLDARDRLITETSAKSEFRSVVDAIDAMLDHIDTSVNVLNAQITAVDMMAGGSTARVIGKFIGNGSGYGGNGGGLGNTAILAGAGLGLGLLLSNNNNNNNNNGSRRR